MSANQNKHPTKENRQALRARFTWHLHPPFDKEFDSTHWWKGQHKVDPVAALYELLRRHPLIGKGFIKRAEIYTATWGDALKCLPAVVNGPHFELIREDVDELHEPRPVCCTCRIGLKSWAGLDITERGNWEFEIGNIKGLDFRDEVLQCRSINQSARAKITGERRAALRKKGQIRQLDNQQGPKEFEASRQSNLKVLLSDLAANPPTAEEWETAIGNKAIEAYRQGYALLAVAPDLKAEKAASLMVKIYGEHVRFNHPSQSKQRAKVESWLSIISEFEKDEANLKMKAKSQVFARYRRALDGIQFT